MKITYIGSEFVLIHDFYKNFCECLTAGFYDFL